MTLLRYLRTTGLRPSLPATLIGMVDYYRNPETQRAFAEKKTRTRRKLRRLPTLRSCHGDDVLAMHRIPRRPPGNVRSFLQVRQEMANLLPADQS